MKRHYIYGHFKKGTSELFYIGQGINRRAWSKDKRSSFWLKTVKKYGYDIKILYSNLTKLEANEIEISLIKKHGRKNINTGVLVNMTDGGEGTIGVKYTEERREKVRAASTGRLHTEETKRLLSVIKTGKTLSDETRIKISLAHKGRKESDVTKERKSIALKGVMPHKDTLRLAALKTSKPIIILKDCSIIEFPSISECSNYLNKDRATVRNYIKNNKDLTGYKICYL